MSSFISINLDSARTREAFARAPRVMIEAIEPRMSRGAEEIARDAKRRAPKAFSNLVNSIRAEKIAQLHYRVSQGMNYGPAVEDGSRPHGVNSQALIPWVERVIGARGKEARDKAFLIARSILRRGTRAQPFMRPAAEAGRSRLVELILEGERAGLQEVFR